MYTDRRASVAPVIKGSAIFSIDDVSCQARVEDQL